MLLIDLHKKGELRGKTLSQIITFAGNGKLTDGNETSRELRELLGHIQLPEIRRFAEECLGSSASEFSEGGRALQDIVNQIGKRLGFKAEDGRYRGSQSAPAYDGLWELPDGRAIVVEVKTEAGFGVKLNRIANYRRRLIGDRSGLSDESVSVLLVVGRGDTDDLEAQIRGSRHAWDMRLISVDALLQIAEIKERVEAPTFQRFHEILVPKEFTRLDEIAALVLSTASDSAAESDEADQAELEEDAGNASAAQAELNGDRKKPMPFHLATVARAEDALKARDAIPQGLITRSRTTFSTPDNSGGIVCLVSKNYHRAGDRFWFSLREHQRAFLDSLSGAWVVLGCGTEDVVFLIPWPDLSARLDSLLTNYRDGVKQWHLHIHDVDGRLMMRPKAGHADISLSDYRLDGRDSD